MEPFLSISLYIWKLQDNDDECQYMSFNWKAIFPVSRVLFRKRKIFLFLLCKSFSPVENFRKWPCCQQASWKTYTCYIKHSNLTSWLFFIFEIKRYLPFFSTWNPYPNSMLVGYLVFPWGLSKCNGWLWSFL